MLAKQLVYKQLTLFLGSFFSKTVRKLYNKKSYKIEKFS